MPRGPIGYANNLFFPDLLHPIVNFNTATSLLSTDSISSIGILLAEAQPSMDVAARSRPLQHRSPHRWQDLTRGIGSFTDRSKCLLRSSVAQSPNSFGRKEVILGFKKW